MSKVFVLDTEKRTLPPSLQSRVDTILSLLTQLRMLCHLTALSQELVRFDPQKLEQPDIEGILYQQGTLFGYEVREYVLEKWQRTCAYCGAKGVPLQVEHIEPKARGGSDQVSNLALSCATCNRAKGTQQIEDFLKDQPKRLARILAQTKAPLRDVAAVNATRSSLLRRLHATGLPLETGQEDAPNTIAVPEPFPKPTGWMRPVWEPPRQANSGPRRWYRYSSKLRGEAIAV